MNVVFDRREAVAANIETFWFRPEEPIRYTAGQFIQLTIPHQNPDERGISRWFTLSSSPSESELSITTKFAVKSSSFKQTLRTLQPGSKLTMTGPMGDFVLPKDKSIPLVFVAGGIGVTPMRSMIKWLSDTNEQRDIRLIYAVNRLEELAFEPLFRGYNGLQFIPIVNQAPAGWQGESGMLTAQRILELAGSTPNKLIYLSGPRPMIEAFYKDLQTQNVSKQNLITDFFPGYTSF